jgi:extracellular elastinolytic metalloproteinase
MDSKVPGNFHALYDRGFRAARGALPTPSAQMETGNVVLPMGPPRNPNVGGPNNLEHNAGEVWCSTLWEVFVKLVAKHQHEEAERRMLTYVIGGLKLTPPRPTFTQARDGIITAVSTLNPEDLAEVWAGFAKRGMGVDAESPPSESTSLAGVVESFDTP